MQTSNLLQPRNANSKSRTRPVTQSSDKRSQSSSRLSNNSTINSTRSSMQSTHSSPESLLNDPELNSVRESLYEQVSFDDIETPKLLRLLSHLREHSQHCAFNEDFPTSKKSRDLSILVREELTRRGTTTRSIQEQKDESNLRIQNLEDKWSEKRKHFQEDTERRLQELDNRQMKEMRRFERIWKDEMPHKYRKPSARLLELKQIEKSLVIAKEIDQADEVHSKAQKLMQIEMENAQNQLTFDYQNAKAKLVKKHEDEKQTFLQNREHERQLLECVYIEEKNKLYNRDNVVALRCKEVASRKHVSRSVNSLPTQLPRDKGISETLLPPLIPPNDPNYVQTRRKEREELNRKRRDYQKKKAEEVLSVYSFDKDNSNKKDGEEIQTEMTNDQNKENKVDEGELEAVADAISQILTTNNDE